MSPRLFPSLLVALPLLAAAQSPDAVVVEYFHTGIKHYFMTASPEERAILDADPGGPAGAWVRTGGRFSAYLNAGAAPGLSGVCRFYAPGANSHFYTADPAECALVKTTPGWIYESTSFHVYQVANGQCATGTTPIYRSYNNRAAFNDSNHRFTTDFTAWNKSTSFGYEKEGLVMCAPVSAADLEADAYRLLRQGSFGPTEAELSRVATMGSAAWIAEQMAMPVTQYPVYSAVPNNRADTCVDNRTPPLTPTSYCARDNYTLFPLQVQFFQDAVAAPDQLRQRVAFALSQVFVTSGVENSRNYGMRHYQQMLRDRAFGNYYDLLYAVTLSPQMGDYLDMANNNRASSATGAEPNENYAREVLQLFSIGTFRLNADGTRRTDGSGRFLTTYDQPEIDGFSRAFTGYTYATAPGQPARTNNPRYFEGTMVAVDANHETGTKQLLDGVVTPAGLSMADDLAFTLRNIANHANVGPFLGKQLIQKLVTGDPSPGYVARVTAVFDNNGVGQRGDLGAVVRAILTDVEARGAFKVDSGYGKMTEPIVYLAALARAFGGRTDGVAFRGASNTLGQFAFYSPSVFNFYPPGYVIPGTTLVGPEFRLQNTGTALARINFAQGFVFAGGASADPTVFGATGTAIDLAPYQAVAADAGALADRLDQFLLGRTMSKAMRQAIVTAVNAVPATDRVNRARTAAFLVVSAPQYQVQR